MVVYPAFHLSHFYAKTCREDSFDLVAILSLYFSGQTIYTEKMNGNMDAELNGNWFILAIRLPINRNQV